MSITPITATRQRQRIRTHGVLASGLHAGPANLNDVTFELVGAGVVCPINERRWARHVRRDIGRAKVDLHSAEE